MDRRLRVDSSWILEGWGLRVEGWRSGYGVLKLGIEVLKLGIEVLKLGIEVLELGIEENEVPAGAVYVYTRPGTAWYGLVGPGGGVPPRRPTYLRT